MHTSTALETASHEPARRGRGEVLLAMIIALFVILFAVPAASAGTPVDPPDRPISRATIIGVVAKVAYAPVGSSTYSSWYGFQRARIDWSQDGCSVPEWAKLWRSVRKYKAYFGPSCARHDFGYRNFGKVKRYDMTAARKASLDYRFYLNMRLQCTQVRGSDNAVCNDTAKLFYLAVSKTEAGRKAFFG